MHDPDVNALPALPPHVAERVLAVHGQPGADWLRALPGRIAALREVWTLREIGPVFPAADASYVAPVRHENGFDLVLKILPSAEWAVREAEALAHWGGRGAVSLRAVNPHHGALLMERAVPGLGSSRCARRTIVRRLRRRHRSWRRCVARMAPPLQYPASAAVTLARGGSEGIDRSARG